MQMNVTNPTRIRNRLSITPPAHPEMRKEEKEKKERERESEINQKGG